MKRKRDESEASDSSGPLRFTTHSKSLYNITQSPGWSAAENKVLKLAIMKFGVGAWTKVMALGICPGKTNAQFNLQVQRMLGQQSLAGFAMIKLDVDAVRTDNEEKISKLDDLNDKSGKQEIYVKSGLIINAGENPTRESKAKLLEENKKKYELKPEEIDERVNEIEMFEHKRKKRIEFEEIIKKYNIFDKEEKEDEHLDRASEIKKVEKEIEEAKKKLTGMQKKYQKMICA
jgi:hypothetical protein